MALTLTRELRFGLQASDSSTGGAGAANGFAGNPALTDLAPFLMIRACISGQVDAATGMLVNIKQVDRVLREHAVPALREAHYVRNTSAPRALLDLFTKIQSHFAPHVLSSLCLALSPFFSLTVHAKEPAVVQLSLRFEFSAAHRLHAAALSDADNWSVFGRCNNVNGHGHNYELEVTVAGAPSTSTGRIVGVPELQQIVNQQIIEPFDHKHLNFDCADFRSPGGLNPTVENIAAVLFRRLKPHIPSPARLASLRLWETPKTMAEFSE